MEVNSRIAESIYHHSVHFCILSLGAAFVTDISYQLKMESMAGVQHTTDRSQDITKHINVIASSEASDIEG